ncbi:MAG: hypothetical protein ACKVZH_29190 [Blastocatellia bacterium]
MKAKDHDRRGKHLSPLFPVSVQQPFGIAGLRLGGLWFDGFTTSHGSRPDRTRDFKTKQTSQEKARAYPYTQTDAKSRCPGATTKDNVSFQTRRFRPQIDGLGASRSVDRN